MASSKLADRHKTATAGVYYRGSDRDRRYEINFGCYGTCANPAHRGKPNPRHWESAHGDYSDACELLAQRKREVRAKRAAVQRGEVIRPDRTFRQVADEYISSRAFERLAPGTQRTYLEALELRILPVFGDSTISEISTDEIAEWLDGMRNGPRQRQNGRTGLSESTINGALTPLRCVFKFAASRKRGYVGTNPVEQLDDDELPAPEQDKRPVQVLDTPKLGRLFAAAPDPLFRLMLETDAATGLRSSELRALVWSDVDLGRERIVVSRQIDTDDIGRRVELKDRALTEHRIIPLVPALVDRLLVHHDGRGPDDWVFGNGRHVKHDALDAAFRKAVKAAGIEREDGKRLSLHSLRHGYGSLLLANGVGLAEVSAWLGHRKISTTERWYAKKIDTVLDLAAERMRELERQRPMLLTVSEEEIA
jgi:integrase